MMVELINRPAEGPANMAEDLNAEGLLQEATRRLALAEHRVQVALTDEERFVLEREVERCKQVIAGLEHFVERLRSEGSGPAEAA